MRTLFTRVSAVSLTTIILGMGLIFYVAASSYLNEIIRQHTETTVRVHALLIQDIEGEPRSSWPDIIQRFETLFDLSIRIVDAPIPVDPTAAQAAPRVDRTSTISDDLLVATWPIADETGTSVAYAHTYHAQYRQEDLLLLALLFVALPTVLYLTLRPIARKIAELGQIARAYSAGDLDARSVSAAPKPLEQLADDLHQMADKLQRKIEEQAVMAHAISHELKTPLTRMRMANDLALREPNPDVDEEYLTGLDDDIAMLESIIAQTLTLSRLTFQQGPLPTESINIRAVVADCLEQCETGSIAVAIGVPPDARVLANPDAVARIFANLLGNAVRYAERRVTVSAVLDDATWVTSIEDDGPGVPKPDRDRVFMPFGRVQSSRDRASGGSGMGLTIAAQLAEKCGGRIWLGEGSVGGAKFGVALPAVT